MALVQAVAGSRILISDLNQYYNLLKGAAGEGITLIYNAAGVVILQPSSDPAAGTELFQIKNNAGTVQSALSSDGRVYSGDGAVGTPGLTFELDKDTGMYRVAANDVALATAGVQRFRIDANGLVYFASQAIVNQVASVNSGTALTVDWNAGDTQRVAMTGNCTFTFSNPISGRTYQLILTQDGTGSRTAVWPATVQWPGGVGPTLTTTATTGKDVITFYYDGTATKYLGVSALNFS